MKRASKANGRVNKSQAIRDALAKDPNASPKELSATLIAKGIKATPAFVSMIKFNMKAKRKVGRKIRANESVAVLAADELVEAKKLVDRVGSIEKAESLLGTLRKLL